MAWSTILPVVALTILVIALIWSVNNTMENNRELRRQKAAALTRRCGSFNDLLTSIPLFYLGKEFTLFAMEQLVSLHQEQIKLEPENEHFQAELRNVQLKLDQLNSLPSLPPHQINSPLEAQNIRQALISASRFVQSLHNTGNIEINKARQLLNHIRSKALQISVDMLMVKADDALREGKYPVVILMYQRAMAEVKQTNASPEKTALLTQIQTKMDEVTALQQQKNDSLDNSDPEHPHNHSMLEDEIDKSLKSEDSWKKKAY